MPASRSTDPTHPDAGPQAPPGRAPATAGTPPPAVPGPAAAPEDRFGTVRVRTLRGEALVSHLPALHRLRASVFRGWPYLYDADPDYESSYMRTYIESNLAAMVIAFDGESVVGAATCLPLVDEAVHVVAPFIERGLDPSRFFYFGESVLLDAYRGRGLGLAFFEGREAHARAVSDAEFGCFCAVVRDESDPRRPAGFVPLDGFWRRRGYAPLDGVTCLMRWREIGRPEETPHPLAFWARRLRPAPAGSGPGQPDPGQPGPGGTSPAAASPGAAGFVMAGAGAAGPGARDPAAAGTGPGDPAEAGAGTINRGEAEPEETGPASASPARAGR